MDRQVHASIHLFPLDMSLEANAVIVLLGAAQAGKTSLMRLMAGLDTPSHGRVLVRAGDVTGMPVRQRNVAMVHQPVFCLRLTRIRTRCGREPPIAPASCVCNAQGARLSPR